MRNIFLRTIAVLLATNLVADPAFAGVFQQFPPLVHARNQVSPLFSEQAIVGSEIYAPLQSILKRVGAHHKHELISEVGSVRTNPISSHRKNVMLASRSGLPVVYKEARLAQELANYMEDEKIGWVTGGGTESKVIHPSSRLKELIPENAETQAQIILNLHGHLVCVGVNRFSTASDWTIAYISHRNTIEEYMMGAYQGTSAISERVDRLLREAEGKNTEDTKLLLDQAKTLIKIRHDGNPFRSEIESEFPYYSDLDAYITKVAKAYVEKLNDVDTAFALAKITRQEEHAALWAWLIPQALSRGTPLLNVLRQTESIVGLWTRVPLWKQILEAYHANGLPLLDFELAIRETLQKGISELANGRWLGHLRTGIRTEIKNLRDRYPLPAIHHEQEKEVRKILGHYVDEGKITADDMNVLMDSLRTDPYRLEAFGLNHLTEIQLREHMNWRLVILKAHYAKLQHTVLSKRPELAKTFLYDLWNYYLPDIYATLEDKQRVAPHRGLLVGISAIQGVGKTTQGEVKEEILKVLGYSGVSLSIDDHYVTHDELCRIRETNPLIFMRSLTHDLELAQHTLIELRDMKSGEVILMPFYEKRANHGDGERYRWIQLQEGVTLTGHVVTETMRADKKKVSLPVFHLEEAHYKGTPLPLPENMGADVPLDAAYLPQLKGTLVPFLTERLLPFLQELNEKPIDIRVTWTMKNGEPYAVFQAGEREMAVPLAILPGGWRIIDRKPDVVYYDGWMTLARAVDQKAFEEGLPELPRPREGWPALESAADIQFAKERNEKLREYETLWDLFDHGVFLYLPTFTKSIEWRIQAAAGMAPEEIKRFVRLFWQSVNPAIQMHSLARNGKQIQRVVITNDDHSIAEVVPPHRVDEIIKRRRVMTQHGIRQAMAVLEVLPELPWVDEERTIARAYYYESPEKAEKIITSLEKMSAEKRASLETSILAKLEKYIALQSIKNQGTQGYAALFDAAVDRLILLPALLQALEKTGVTTIRQLLMLSEEAVEALDKSPKPKDLSDPIPGRRWRVEVKKVLFDLGILWGKWPNEGAGYVRWDEVNFDALEKPVLVAANLDVVKDNKIKDPTKIDEALNGLEDIHAPLVLVSHNGRPAEAGPEGLSLAPVAEYIQQKWPDKHVIMAQDLTGPVVREQIANLQADDILVLENYRFDARAESTNAEDRLSLAKDIITGVNGKPQFSLYLNNDFASAHRPDDPKNPSSRLVDFTHFLPSVAGPLLIRELHELEPARVVAEHPFVLIIGGAKVKDKIEAIANPLRKMGEGDTLAIGGLMAFTFLAAQAELDQTTIHLGASQKSVESKYLSQVKSLLELARARNVRVILPLDHVVTDDAKKPTRFGVSEDANLSPLDVGADIGPKTTAAIVEAIEGAQLISWNGPVGAFDLHPQFANGTFAIAHAGANAKQRGKKAIGGGGDTLKALSMAGVKGQWTHESTGGGSYLQILGLADGEDWAPVAALKRLAALTRFLLPPSPAAVNKYPLRALATSA